MLLPTLLASLLAFANGANDNIKGAATLVGSGTMGLRGALWLATLATLLGSLTSVVLAQGLLLAFTGKGLVAPEVAGDPAFASSVGLAAGATVLLATRLGLPISTTHALVGALVGAGLVAGEGALRLDGLLYGLVLPLLSSPLLAAVGTAAAYPALRHLRRRSGITQETCVCIGDEVVAVHAEGSPSALSLRQSATVTLGTTETCRVRYNGEVLGLRARTVLDAAHIASACAVSFARGVNDTPKIAALLLVGGALGATTAASTVAVTMALGGLLAARRVAETLAHGVTTMNPGQGFTANLVTSVLVIGASRFGLPVSTTHVSGGALIGLGMSHGGAHWKVIRRVLLAWCLTLPVAAALAALGALALAA